MDEKPKLVNEAKPDETSRKSCSAMGDDFFAGLFFEPGYFRAEIT